VKCCSLNRNKQFKIVPLLKYQFLLHSKSGGVRRTQDTPFFSHVRNENFIVFNIEKIRKTHNKCIQTELDQPKFSQNVSVDYKAITLAKFSVVFQG